MTDPLAARIAELVTAAPPLTEQQRHRIRTLLTPTLNRLTLDTGQSPGVVGERTARAL